MAEGQPNYTFMQALEQYNGDQVMTQTMYYIELGGNAASLGLESVQIYGKNFTIPNRTNEFADVNYRGYPIPTPTVLKMENSHSMSIIADVDGALRRGFLKWQARQIDPLIGTQRASFGSDRRPTLGAGGHMIRVNLLAPNYTDIESTITIYGVRIENVGGISLSNDEGGIATFDVTFRSVYWECLKSDNADPQEETANVYDANGFYLQAGLTDITTPEASQKWEAQ